jgi:excisionase family DNA binding protein
MTDDANKLPTDKLAYTPDEAARAVGISVRSIFKEIQAERLEARKPYPTKTLIPAESLKAWLAATPKRAAVAA